MKINEETYLFGAPKESFEDGFRHDLFHLNAFGEIFKHRPESRTKETAHLYWTDGQHYYYTYYEDINSTEQSVHKYKDGNFVAQTPYITYKEFPPFLIKDKIYNFYPDRIEKYKASKDSLIHEQSIPFKKKHLPSYINLTHREGNIWFLGLNKITKLSLRPKNFKLSLNNKFDDNNIARPIRGIVSSPDGTIYVAELIELNIKHPNIENAAFRMTEDYLGGDLGVLYDNDRLWIGKEYAGLSSFNVKTKERYDYGKGLVWQAYKSPNGTVWAGAGEGLFKLDTIQKDLILFPNYDEYEALQKSSIYAFHLNEKGTWLSTSSGVYLVDLIQEKILAHYSDTQTGDYYIPANQIAHIHEDKEGIFWLATKGQGLIHWNPATRKSEQLTQKNTGLSHNVLYAVYEDDFGNL